MEGGESLSLFLIDVDQVKSFNDTYGHQVGDQVLKLIAGALREHVREGDMATRHGDDELMAICPRASLATCRDIAERVRSTMAERRIRRRTTGGEICSITISVGVAQFRPGEHAESLIDAATARFIGPSETGAIAS